MQRQKRLYDRRAVKRIFSLGDWVMRYYAPAKKCKLDSPWTGPYLVVSFLGWTLGIQKDPNSPIVMIHCQDAKKVPAPPGAVSWLTSKESSIKPSVTVLGASTMHRTRPSSLSLGSDPSNVEGAVTGDRSVRDGGVSITSSVDVSSATLISVHSGVDSVSVELDSSCVIHPFYVHKMDSGPVRLMTIAHAFNYRVAVLRDGVKSALRVGRSRKAERCFMINADIPWGQQVAVMFQIVSTLMADVPGYSYYLCAYRNRQAAGMDTPGFASPIRVFRENLCHMRKSNDVSDTEQTLLDSLGVLDLDLSLGPDAFGLKAFDAEMGNTRMLPGSGPCDLRLLLPDVGLGEMGFHDVVIENLLGTSVWRSKHVTPADVIGLRQRWPKAVFQVMRERSVELDLSGNAEITLMINTVVRKP